MAAATAAHMGQQLAIVVNGVVISAPRVDGVIREQSVLTGRWTRQEADEIVSGLNGK
jgi:preprotein translocase subunit SecD